MEEFNATWVSEHLLIGSLQASGFLSVVALLLLTIGIVTCIAGCYFSERQKTMLKRAFPTLSARDIELLQEYCPWGLRRIATGISLSRQELDTLLLLTNKVNDLHLRVPCNRLQREEIWLLCCECTDEHLLMMKTSLDIELALEAVKKKRVFFHHDFLTRKAETPMEPESKIMVMGVRSKTGETSAVAQ